MCTLVNKYNVPGPRYTSYPTVPYWDLDGFSAMQWQENIKTRFSQDEKGGISLYIHLPFCESLCTFCGCHKRITKRHELETPYLMAIIKEWELYRQLFNKKPIIKEVHIGGGTPTFFSPENLRMLLQGVFRQAHLDENAALSFEGHPNNTTYEHLKTLYNLGFRRVCYGVQDYNQKVQKAINRIQTYEQVVQVTQMARDIGYNSVGHDIIYGLPFQTKEDIINTLKLTKKLMPDRIAFYSYAHVPWRKGNGQRGYRDEDLPTAEEKIIQQEIGREELQNIGYKEVGMDHYALTSDELYKAKIKGNLHRNFMGYTPTHTNLMIGLGVSSISDSWNSFAQNVKSVEEYQHLVNSGILPVYRGHLLTKEDGIIRKHILNLMCQFTTDLNYPPMAPELKTHILTHIAEFEKDGLIKLVNEKLWVTPQGRAYVRNIAMAFDLRLHRKKPETQMFSMTV